MPRTAVGLFRDPKVVDDVVREIENLGFPRNDVHVLGEPLDMAVTGVLSVPHLDFEVALGRELLRMGASKEQADAYLDGVRHGGVLVFATGSGENVDTAAQIMSRYGAAAIGSGVPEMALPAGVSIEEMTPNREVLGQAGRVQYSREGDSGRVFVW